MSSDPLRPDVLSLGTQWLGYQTLCFNMQQPLATQRVGIRYVHPPIIFQNLILHLIIEISPISLCPDLQPQNNPFLINFLFIFPALLCANKQTQISCIQREAYLTHGPLYCSVFSSTNIYIYIPETSPCQHVMVFLVLTVIVSGCAIINLTSPLWERFPGLDS